MPHVFFLPTSSRKCVHSILTYLEPKSGYRCISRSPFCLNVEYFQRTSRVRQKFISNFFHRPALRKRAMFVGSVTRPNKMANDATANRIRNEFQTKWRSTKETANDVTGNGVSNKFLTNVRFVFRNIARSNKMANGKRKLRANDITNEIRNKFLMKVRCSSEISHVQTNWRAIGKWGGGFRVSGKIQGIR